MRAGIRMEYELDVGAGASLSERHAQRVEDKAVRMCAASCHPMTLRDQTSMTKAKDTRPFQQRR